MIISGYRSDDEGRLGRRLQKAQERSTVLRTNYGDGGGGGGRGYGISESESTWEVRSKSETFFTSETEQDLEVGQR